MRARMEPAIARRALLSMAVALTAAVVFVSADGWSGLGHVALGAVVAVFLLLDVELPGGGSVPLGHAFLMALAYAMPADEFGLVAGLALVLCLPVLAHRQGPERAAGRLLGFLLAAGAAGAVGAVIRWGLPAGTDPYAPRTALLGLLAGGVAYLVVDTLAGRRPVIWQLDVSLLCAAALLGMAYREGWWMLVFATLPLLMTRFSFQRYSVARRTYQQTIQALAIVPELAGHAPLGHGERTAAYAGALAAELGVTGADRDRIVIAARLHHIGHISVPECAADGSVEENPVGRAGADMLRETGFLAEVADLVQTVGRPAEPGDGVHAAIVRVATAFDELVLERPERVPGALALVASQQRDAVSQEAVEALRRLVADTGVVDAAIADGAPLTQAAAAARARTD